MTISRIGVAVIGGGPAGISAAIAASNDGASVMLVDSERRLGGKLNQAIHDGFGMMRYEVPLTGPEYAFNDIEELEKTNTVVLLQTTVNQIIKIDNGYQLTLSNRHGISVVEANAIVLTNGCREKSLFEMGIHGTRPSGVFTSGTAQYLLNVTGQLPTRKCIVLGSDNLTLNTVGALALNGTNVLGVYEPGRVPKGYLYYMSRCLLEHGIGFHAEHTISRVFGTHRIQGVELARADSAGAPIRGSETLVKCDSLIMSGGLVPQNALTSGLGLPMDKRTQGPSCDQNRMSLVDGIFVAGSALHISDLVDYVSESGTIAGQCAARYFPRERKLSEINAGSDFVNISPQYIDTSMLYGETVIYFSPSRHVIDSTIRAYVNGIEVMAQPIESLRPTETSRIELSLANSFSSESTLGLRID